MLNGPDYAMYYTILPEFMKYMFKELESNYLKGDRNGAGGWLEVKDNKFWLQELYYHVGKLQAAVMADNIERIKENCADIANISMMMLDTNIDLLKHLNPAGDRSTGTIYMKQTILQIAMVCYAANRAYCINNGESAPAPWEQLTDQQQESYVKGVAFRVENLDAPASAQHDAWMQSKADEGWVYGEVKDEVAKTHPCMMAYDQLPGDQQVKDSIFIGIVNAIVGSHSVTWKKGKDLNYGEALYLLKKGHKLRRASWKGEMFVVHQKGYPDGIGINKNTSEALGIPEGTVVGFRPYLLMAVPKGSSMQFGETSNELDCVPWTANQTDQLATDWQIV